MKTAGRRIPNRRAHPPGNRAHGAGDRNRSRLINWAAKQGNFQPQGTFFLLTSTFIELIGSYADILLESLSSHRGTYNARDSGKQRGERLSDSVEKTWM